MTAAVNPNVKSGWCNAAPGAVVPHKSCRWTLCGCPCHQPEPKERR